MTAWVLSVFEQFDSGCLLWKCCDMLWLRHPTLPPAYHQADVPCIFRAQVCQIGTTSHCSTKRQKWNTHNLEMKHFFDAKPTANSSRDFKQRFLLFMFDLNNIWDWSKLLWTQKMDGQQLAQLRQSCCSSLPPKLRSSCVRNRHS